MNTWIVRLEGYDNRDTTEVNLRNGDAHQVFEMIAATVDRDRFFVVQLIDPRGHIVNESR